MMRVSLELRPEQVARWLADDWEELGAVLPLLARHVLKEDHEDFAYFIGGWGGEDERKAVRAFALMIAGACAEAE